MLIDPRACWDLGISIWTSSVLPLSPLSVLDLQGCRSIPGCIGIWGAPLGQPLCRTCGCWDLRSSIWASSVSLLSVLGSQSSSESESNRVAPSAPMPYLILYIYIYIYIYIFIVVFLCFVPS